MAHTRYAAAALVRNKAVLLCLRAAGRNNHPSVWDFPGGHGWALATGSAARGLLQSPSRNSSTTGMMRDVRAWY